LHVFARRAIVVKDGKLRRRVLIVTLYQGARNSKPAQADDLTWPELAATLEEEANRLTAAPDTADPKEQKKCLLAWSPHTLRQGAKSRAVETVAAVTALVLDVDNDKGEHVSPDEVIAALEREGWAAVLYASPSDTPAHRKFRVVSPIVELIAPDDCREVRLRFAEALGLGPTRGSGVTGAIDASKLFFVGRLHGTPPREVWNVAGEPVDVAALTPTRLAWGAAQAPRHDLTPLDELPPADQGIAAALGAWEAHDGRKWDLCGELGGAMRQAGYTAPQCEAVIRAWLPPADPAVDVQAGVAWALAAWHKAPHEVSGLEALAVRLGAEHGAVVAEAVTAGSWVGRARARHRPFRAPGWTRPVTAAGDDDAGPLGPRSFFDSPEVPLDYFCDGLRLARSNGKISLVAGLPGAGKGPLADYLALCFALGLPAFGRWPCRKSDVLILDCEGTRLTMRRMRRMARALGIDPRELDAVVDVRDVSSLELLTERFGAAVEAHGAEVVILDSYTSAMMATGLDPNKIEFANLAKALGSLDRLVLGVAHANKAPLANERPTLQQVSGSGALAAMAATGIAVWHPNVDTPATIRVACMRAPETAFEPFDVTFHDTPGDGLALELVTASEARKDDAARLTVKANRVLAFMHQHPAFAYTVDALRVPAADGDAKTSGPAIVERVLGAFVRAGVVAYQPDSRSKGKYALCGDAPEEVAIGADGEVAPVEKAAGTVGGFQRRNE
jgi:hypothetical protein